jgi:hypothetical protein
MTSKNQFQENSSPQLDDRILREAQGFLYQKRKKPTGRWWLKAGSVLAALGLVVVFAASREDGFSFFETQELLNSPVEVYTDLNIDIGHDKEIIEDLAMLTDPDANLDEIEE